MNRQLRIELAFAIGAMALGVYLLIGSSSINLGTGYDRIGPRFFPYIIAGGLLVTASMMIIESLRSKREPVMERLDLTSLLTIIVALVLCVLLLESLGFILSVALLFTLIARAFKSYHLLRDPIVGLILAIVIYYIFTSGLGLVLPRGILTGII